MIESTTDARTQDAFAAAHEARGAAVREMFVAIRNMFKGSSPKTAPAALVSA